MSQKNAIYADLHVHSTASDGMLSPTELVHKALSKGITALGLTDHDTLSGIREATLAADKSGLRIIPGIELSCGWPDREVSFHVLGLFVDPSAPSLLNLLDNQRKFRFTRALRILDLLESQKIDVALLREQFHENPKKVLGRPHVARYLVDKGVAKDNQDAFERFLKRGAPAYVPKNQVLPKVGVEAIHTAGGLSVIAHPGLLSDWSDVWRRIDTLPWDGIEIYYSEHSESQIEHFEKIASQIGLLASGGSDYHGENGKPENYLGSSGLNAAQFCLLENSVAKLRKNRKTE